MLHHTSFAVKDYEKSLVFYDETLALLGMERVYTMDKEIPEHGRLQWAGYGKGSDIPLWITPNGKNDEAIGQARAVHFAFSAPSVEAVHAWYEKALELGGTDNGAPGPRPHYGPHYYGAFIIDPSGWRLEACFFNYQKE